MIDPLVSSALGITPAPLTLVSTVPIPNVFPSHPSGDYRIAIILDAPTKDEETSNLHGVGQAYKLLDSILGSAGVLRSSCFVGYVCSYCPPNNKKGLPDITEFDEYREVVVKGVPKMKRMAGSWSSSPKVMEGMTQLRKDLVEYRPNVTLVLGYGSLYFARGPGHAVDEWRGSILDSSIGKIVPSYDPTYVLRNYNSTWMFLRWDVLRVRQEAVSPTISLPQRTFDLDLTADAICHKLDHWPVGEAASVDIEGGLDGWTCMGIASSPYYAFIVAFGQHSLTDQGRIYISLSRFLGRSDIPKILQNSLYDNFVLYYGFNMLIRNVREDTMLKWASIYSELPKALDVQASVLTREPAWKHLIAYSKREQEKRAKAGVDPYTEQRNKYRACCIDCTVTFENSLAMERLLDDKETRYYRFNMSLLPAFLRMEHRGFHYNKELAATELLNCRAAIKECATRLELRVGYSLLGDKGSISQTKAKKCLYEEKGYPPQYNGRGPDKKVATDVGALLKLAKKHPGDPLLADLLLFSRLDGIRKTLEVATDPDGRARCAYNIVGAAPMRITCYESPTGSGANLQTITSKLRKLYLADPGFHLFQCDLAGADGWTVAAHCLRHNDPTMWDDYREGLKPAKIIALMFTFGPTITQCSREELKRRCDEASLPGGCCDQSSWLYFACKRIQHATNYGVHARTGCEQIMEDSYKKAGTPIYLSEKDFEVLQRYYFVRYPGLYQWHIACRQAVFDGRDLTSASGHTRKFFGRRKSWDKRSRQVVADQDTWREWLADEPQHNTTYATNLALSRLWNDPENRQTIYGFGSTSERPACAREQLRIEPLHQVHDALIGQFRIEDTEWAVARIRHYFNNPLTIAGISLVIPFEGAYGPSWGELGTKYGGGVI